MVPKAGNSSPAEALPVPNELSNHLLHLIYGIAVHTFENACFFFKIYITLATDDLIL